MLSGSGAPVLLVHGSFATSSAWRRVIAKMNLDELSAIAVDLPGSGKSDEPPADSSTLLEHETVAVEAVARDAVTEPVHLVGHSYGGVVALAVALSGRVALRSLTLFEPLPLAFLADTGDGEVHSEMTSFVAQYRTAFDSGERWAFRRVIDLWGEPGAFDALPDSSREAMVSATAQNLAQWEANLAYQPTLATYRSIGVPTRIVRGEHAHRVSQLISQRLVELIPNSEPVEIGEAGHFMIHSHPAECAKYIVGPDDCRLLRVPTET
jgi:pimeloyl-ACP methyl ester carboxylesterase